MYSADKPPENNAMQPSQHRYSSLLTLLCLLITGIVAADDKYANAGGWRDLFNGQDLTGWTPKITGHEVGQNFGNTFRVENGLLQVRYDQYDQFSNQFGHLFFAEPFSHYVLHIEYRFTGEQASGGPKGWAVRNSGVMLHSQAPATMTLKQPFPDSIEAQFLGGLSDGKARPTGNLCTPGTHVSIDGKLHKPHCVPADAPTFDGDQWVDFVVVVLGHGSIRHYVNGEEVLAYANPVLDAAEHDDEPQYKLSSGYIALQSESHPIDFRKVRILSLAGCTDTTSDNYQPWAIKSDPEACSR